MPHPSDDATVLASRFGIDPVSLTALGAFESEVLAGDGPSDPAVLKVIDPFHRTAEEVQGELAWHVRSG